jgi:hypothetical protein
MSDTIQFNYKDHWQEIEINLERVCHICFSRIYSELLFFSKPNSGDQKLGFTIAGGIDIPFASHHFTYIIVTKIVENSLAHRDNRLK